LNDPAFVEIARGLAERIVRERADSASDRERLRYGFLLCLGRAPLDRELDTLGALLRSGGADQGTTGPDWLSVARALLNLDEFVTRE
jgi:hypothetical protein